MFHKIVIGVLAATLIGAAGVGLIDAARPVDTTLNLTPVPEAAEQVPAEQVPAEQIPAASVDTQAAGAANGSGPVQQQQAVDVVGAAWHGAGEIVGVDANGFYMALGDATTVYVELGQPSYWQAQGVTLTQGDFVTVDGFDNGEQIHAATVITGSGAVLMVRMADGQPLWSGGASGGQNGNGAANSTTGEVQVAAEDWVTIEGTLTALDASNASILTPAGETITFQIGQTAFWQGQGVTLTLGDELSVLGFWQLEQFQAGEIQKVTTGERIMLRDPNGRPLWGGPGRAGNGGNGAGGRAASPTAGVNGQGNNGQGGGQGTNGQGSNGQGGRQYRGGRA